MKKITTITALVLCAVLLFTACGSEKEQPSEKEKSAVDIVKEYFGYWANKDKASMDRLVVKEQQTGEDDPDVTLVKSLKLNSCIEVTEEMKEEWDPELYPDPYDFTYVDVDFDITFEGGVGSGYEDGNYHSRFYLIKEKEGSQWKIVMWGLG